MADARQEALVDHLKRAGLVRSPAVEAALRAVPRERFLPDIPPEQALSDRAIAVLERDGRVVSSCSQPSMIARMLELLDVRSGNRVLEVGTGTGYNAALLAHLAGTGGNVVTLEIEQELAVRARGALANLGLYNVGVLLGDGRAGCAERAPFERIIVTAATDIIAPAWTEQLIVGGRLVLPLTQSDGQWAIGFIREESGFRSIGATACAFVPLR